LRQNSIVKRAKNEGEMPIKRSKEDLEYIALDLNFSINLYITIYVVEDGIAKDRFVERLRFILNKRNVQLVELDIVSADRDDIHGPVVITENKYHNEKPRWFKNSPFMLLIQNLENLSKQNSDSLTKLNKLALYLGPYDPSKELQVPVTLDKNSFISAIITESDLKLVSSIVRRLGRNARHAFRAKKVRENSEGRWEIYC
jgi:hypothetical protein